MARGDQERADVGHLADIVTLNNLEFDNALVQRKMETQFNRSFESKLFVGHHPLFWLALLPPRLKRDKFVFFQSRVVGERGGKCGKYRDVKKVKWASGGGEEVLISRAACSRERGIGRGGGM